MNTVTNVFKIKFKKVLFHSGFKLHRNTFYRAVNDIVQTVMLIEKRPIYSVGFSVMPLFWGFSDLSNEGYSIHELRSGKMKRHWEYHPSSPFQYNDDEEYVLINSEDKYIEEMIDNMLNIVITHVIPFFERAYDCKSALEMIKEYETSIYGHDIAVKNEAAQYWWHIKLGLYERALEHLQVVKRNRQLHNEDNMFDRANRIDETKMLIDYFKLQYELATSIDVHQTRKDMLSRDSINESFKRNLQSDSWQTICSVGNPMIAKKQIRAAERELMKLLDENSPRSKELSELKIAKEKKLRDASEYFSELIELLSIPDTAYFRMHIKAKEEKSRAFLENLSKN